MTDEWNGGAGWVEDKAGNLHKTIGPETLDAAIGEAVGDIDVTEQVANAVVLTCSDADFTISSDGTTYGTTVNITSIAAGAESATLYVKNTTPAPGAALGPRVARITAAVGSWT